MHVRVRSAALVAAFTLFIPAGRAAEPPSPLRLVPAENDLLVSVPDARQLAETFTGLELLQKLEPFGAYREALDSTNYRHFRQLVAYYEQAMNAPWPRLLDDVAGGGVVVGVKVGKAPAPTLLVVQGRDEQRVRRFARLAFELLEQELARRDENARPAKGEYRGVETIRAGDQFFAAVAGSAILVANQEKALHAALDLYAGKGGKSCADVAAVGDAAKLLPANPLATLWFNLDAARQNPAVAAALKVGPRDDPAQTIVFGGYLDVAGRSPFVAAALVREGSDWLVTVRMPRGRNGMGPDSLLHVPPATAGSWPLLQPKGMLFSTSFYLDVARIWQDRNKLFPEKVSKSFEKADKDTPPYLGGLRISKFLPQVGSHHRFVAAVQAVPADRSFDGPPIPAFALVSELRDPEGFGSMMEAALRGAALLGGFKIKLELAEEKVGGVTLVGYRFAGEQPQLGPREASLLPFFSPCFARVGDQFLWCSTIELGRELVTTLQSEKREAAGGAVCSRLSAAGAADYLRSVEDAIVAQGMLDQALSAGQASAEAKALCALLRTLGPLDESVRYEDERFGYDFRLKGLK
jgi:hypothetical protein